MQDSSVFGCGCVVFEWLVGDGIVSQDIPRQPDSIAASERHPANVAIDGTLHVQQSSENDRTPTACYAEWPQKWLPLGTFLNQRSPVFLRQ